MDTHMRTMRNLKHRSARVCPFIFLSRYAHCDCTVWVAFTLGHLFAGCKPEAPNTGSQPRSDSTDACGEGYLAQAATRNSPTENSAMSDVSVTDLIFFNPGVRSVLGARGKASAGELGTPVAFFGAGSNESPTMHTDVQELSSASHVTQRMAQYEEAARDGASMSKIATCCPGSSAKSPGFVGRLSPKRSGVEHGVMGCATEGRRALLLLAAQHVP